MACNVGDILQGKVTSVTKFGAFVKLENNDVGMVHISEVASAFVKEIGEFVKEGQEVKVKVIRVDDKGKISLSMKQAQPPKKPQQYNRPATGGNRRPDNYEFKPKASGNNMSFEDMMSKFKQSSEEKMSDLKRTMEFRKGSNRRSK